MSLKSLSNLVAASLFFLFSSCGNQSLPSIGDNVAFPGAVVAYDNSHFLMLNTNANGDYADGSIQRYSVNSSGVQTLMSSFSVPSHGSEIAVSADRKLVALSFDAGHGSTDIQFYNYSDPSNPSLVNTLTLKESGGRQAVKRLKFFAPSSSVSTGYYYIYGEILTDAQNDGTYAGIIPRVFAARIKSDFSSPSVLFYLSYGIGDPNAFAAKSDAIVPNDYSFGSVAPTYDSAHDLLYAFPSGSFGGLSGASSTTPATPNVYCYFNGTLILDDSGSPCSAEGYTSATLSAAMDMRVYSMMVVDFKDLIKNSVPINNSTYFVPLAWNTNGIHYGASSNSKDLTYATYVSNKSDGDVGSLSFQTGFHDSYWVNTPKLGVTSGNEACFSTSSTSSSNAYNLSSLGNNALLVTKAGINSSLGEAGNEVFQIGGLDILSNSINALRTQRGADGTYSAAGESDFKGIANLHILDRFNTYYSTTLSSGTTLSSLWTLNSSNVSPIVPYMYSRVTGVSAFNGILQNAAIDLNVLNFGSNTCRPYWVRDSDVGFGGFGVDSAWLSSSPVLISDSSVSATTKSTYTSAVIDPTQPSVFAFPYNAGAQRCTDVSPTAGTPFVFCANFLTGDISHFTTSSSTTTFNQF